MTCAIFVLLTRSDRSLVGEKDPHPGRTAPGATGTLRNPHSTPPRSGGQAIAKALTGCVRDQYDVARGWIV